MWPSCCCRVASSSRTKRSAAWEYRFAPVLAAELRRKRRGRAGVSWYLDETYVKVAGRWGYLYRAIDGAGELLDSMLSEHRYASRRTITPADRQAIRWILGRRVLHRRSQYLNNLTEQDHRAIKQRSYPMLGFGRFESAARFCAAVDELRQDLSGAPSRRPSRPAARAAPAVRRALARVDHGDGGRARESRSRRTSSRCVSWSEI